VVVNRRWISTHWIVISQSSCIYATRIIDKVQTGSLNYVLFVPNVLFKFCASVAACELEKFLISDSKFYKDELKADLLPVSYGRAHSAISLHKRSSEYSLYTSYIWYKFVFFVDDWLTVHRSIILFHLQSDAQNSYLFTHNIFIRIPRNRLHGVMKRYSPTGRRNRGRPLKSLLDT
jgi:hypothetical protein